jgi:isopentenyldiphosphate isomerase
VGNYRNFAVKKIMNSHSCPAARNNQYHNIMEELFPLVNEQGEVTGKASRSECHSGSFLLHPVIHLHILNSRGELFLQKRALTKDTQPGKWDTSVGGHVDYGETIETALFREAFEELGVKDFKPVMLARYIWQSEVERELVTAFYTTYDGTFELNRQELDDGIFWTMADIKNNVARNIFTPNFEHDFQLLTEILKENTI